MSSIIKVDNIQNQSGANIIKEDSNTITLGASGDTIALASGASQTGFGRTGTVDWQTGSIKTATFTAANGEGYFANTSGGAFIMNLPAGSAGAIVSVVDYTNTFQTNNLTITPNGSEKIGGVAGNAVLSTEGQSVTFVYVDGTEGWKNTMDSTSNATGVVPSFVTATGGTITTVCTNFKVHTFTGPGTFAVSNAGNSVGSNTVDYMVVAGGGGGRGNTGDSDGQGGAGAGGYRESSGAASGCYSASPLGSGVSALPVSVTSFPITIGSGGTGGLDGSNPGARGSNSVFSTITSTGGGSNGPVPESAAAPGGSGGGAGGGGGGTCKGIGNTPPVSPSQGNPGGNGANAGPSAGGGGGGAGAVGSNGSAPSGGGGDGGAGATSSINGTPTARAGGGGGVAYTQGSCQQGVGGSGGGGAGGNQPGYPGVAGTDNTGGGGGSGATKSAGPSPTVGTAGGNGGSGIVIIRYKFQ